MLRTILLVAAGFVAAALTMLALGFVSVQLVRHFDSEYFYRWTHMSVLAKAGLSFGIDCILLVPAAMLWSRKRPLALGVLAFLTYELVLMLWIIAASR